MDTYKARLQALNGDVREHFVFLDEGEEVPEVGTSQDGEILVSFELQVPPEPSDDEEEAPFEDGSGDSSLHVGGDSPVDWSSS